MSKVIDLNDITTYPEEFLSFIKSNFDRLENTFRNKEIIISAGSGLFDFINQILRDYYFIGIHASRTYDKQMFCDNGILVPYSSDVIVNSILEPIKNNLGENYDLVFGKVKKQLKNDKYKSLWFVIGSINDIAIKNGFWMLDYYGGELLPDTLGYANPFYKKISSFGIPVAVIFKIKFTNINDNDLSDIYSFMLNKAMKDKGAHLFKEIYVFENIPKEDIIEVKELKNYE